MVGAGKGEKETLFSQEMKESDRPPLIYGMFL